MENDNSEIAIILSHANNPKRKKLLEECLQSIEIEKLVSCNFPLDVNAQKLTDWMLYSSENDLLTENQYSEFDVSYYQWRQKEDGSIVTKNQTYEHGYAVYNLIKNALLFCKRLGKDIVHIINYDYIIPKKIINEHSDCFTNNNTLNLLVYQDEVELTGYSTSFLSGKIDYLLLFFEHYKSKFEYYRDFDNNVPRSFFLEGKILKFYSSKNQSEIKLNHFDTIQHSIQINRESLFNMEMFEDNIYSVLQRYRITENKSDDYFNEEMPSTNRLFGLKDLLEYYGANKDWNVLEIGSYAGASAELISKYVGKIICCDVWEEYIHPLERAQIVYNDFLSTKEINPNIIECKKNSNDFVKEIQDETFDMIYIDADHQYHSVKNDISSWFSKVKPGGILCGHDYFMDDVKRAVDEFFGKQNIKYFKDSSWSYRKPEVIEYTNTKKFSIIVPTYKRTEILNRALNSIKNQTYTNYEVMVCSEGYSREDEICVENFKDDRFTYRYIDKPNFKNYGNIQRNEMVKMCTGDYTIWLDDDNIIYPDYLEYANNTIDKDYGMLIFKIKHNYVGVIPKDVHMVIGEIDTLNVMIKTDIAKSFKWLMQYDADYYFIKECERYCLQTGIPIRYLDKIIGNHN